MAVSSGRHPAFARLALIVVGACALALLGATDGQAATVTVGSPLTGSFFPSTFSLIGTVTNSTLPEPGANLASPVTGTIVRWRIMDGSGGPYRLRVLTPDGATAYTGGAASDSRAPAGTGVETFTANLSIRAGQTIGLDNTNPTDGIGNSEFTGAVDMSWAPGLGLGETRVATGGSGNELSFNADVEYSPPLPTASPIGPLGSPPPVVKCIVPKLTGEKLKAAKKKLKAADCKLGKVTKEGGVTTKSGKVAAQSPRSGKKLAPGAKVNVKLG